MGGSWLLLTWEYLDLYNISLNPKFRSKSLQLKNASSIEFKKANNKFYIGTKAKHFEIEFFLSELTQMGLKHTKRSKIAVFWGAGKKKLFHQYFMRISGFHIFLFLCLVSKPVAEAFFIVLA